MSAPYGHRVVTLKGHPQINEDGAAAATIQPGYLVKGVGTINVHSTAGGPAARAIALEKPFFGTGIDTTYANSGQNNAAGNVTYASGEVVRVGVFAPGMRFVGWIASGQAITADNFMESAGDGTFRVYNSGTILARALETVTATALTKINLEAV